MIWLLVEMPCPRHRGGTEFLAIRRNILEKLGMASANPQPEYVI
jgi:NitT/TauT family transport system ATP-binding protein/sulfonate transport system ATP-binding protein